MTQNIQTKITNKSILVADSLQNISKNTFSLVRNGAAFGLSSAADLYNLRM